MTCGSSEPLVTAGDPLLPLLDRCGTDPARTEREDPPAFPLYDGVAPRGAARRRGACERRVRCSRWGPWVVSSRDAEGHQVWR